MQTDYVEIFKQRLADDRYYQSLLAQMAKQFSQGKMVQASMTKYKIKEYEEIKKQAFINEKNSEYISLKDVKESLEGKDGLQFLYMLDTICFCLDTIDTCSMNIQDIFDRAGQAMVLEAFKPLRALKVEIKALMLKIQQHDTEEHSQLWADTLDRIEEYLFERARVFQNKADKITNKYKSKK